MVRRSELLCALSLSTDLSQGQSLEWELRACRIALALGAEVGADLRQVYDLALLRYIGCTAHARDVADMLGDDIAVRTRAPLVDLGRPSAVFVDTWRNGGPGIALRLMAQGPGPVKASFRAGCEVAQMLAQRLGFAEETVAALSFAFERFDGRGFPDGSKADAIPLPMRVVQLAQDADALYRAYGLEGVLEATRERAGAMYDPALAAAFGRLAGALLPAVHGESAWEPVIAAEPAPQVDLAGGELDEAFATVADYADLKSAFTAGHSRGVGELAGAAAGECRLPPADVELVRRAGLVHDLGRTAVTNAIWDKPGPLTDAEWERVRLHPYYTERMLARCPVLAEAGALGSHHHERQDGKGYHRGIPGSMLPLPARLLAAADVFQALGQPRAHRPARSAEEATAALRADTRLDPDAVEAVLAGAGHRPRRSPPAELTAREIEVLRLISRGRPSKAIALELGISKRTVDHHIAHIYEKTGVTTRGGAILWAIERGLSEV